MFFLVVDLLVVGFQVEVVSVEPMCQQQETAEKHVRLVWKSGQTDQARQGSGLTAQVEPEDSRTHAPFKEITSSVGPLCSFLRFTRKR